jgi:hypothetical protein
VIRARDSVCRKALLARQRVPPGFSRHWEGKSRRMEIGIVGILLVILLIVLIIYFIRRA